MTTTALAFELIIIGYQVLVWVWLVGCFPECQGLLVRALNNWKEVTIAISIPAAYTAGAIMNPISAWLFSFWEDKIYAEKPPSVMRAAILLKNPEAHNQVMKYFEAPRVLRASTLNILLTGIFLSYRIESFPTLFFFAVAAAAAAWAWYETTDNYYTHLGATYKTLEDGATNSRKET